jgi:hypothetical protein
LGLVLVLALTLDSCGAPNGGPSEWPAATNITRRIVERAQRVAQAGNATRYSYDKRALVEELDSNGAVTKSTEKHYKVDLIAGFPFPKLVRITGRELTQKELERENRRETEFRDKVTRMDLRRQAESGQSWITQEMIDRFEFIVIKREALRGRPALVLSFFPKEPPAVDGTIQDKILTRLAGTIWVDEEDDEVARLDASLQGGISMGWLGWIGSLNRCQLTLDRVRMPEGVWVNMKHTLWFAARKLFGQMRYRTTEESSGFQPHRPTAK